MATLNEIQDKIAQMVDESATAATAGGTAWNIRLDLINRAQQEWAETYDWQVLYKEYNTLTSQSTGNASITMPVDFRKLASYPIISQSNTKTDTYPEIRPQEKKLYGRNDEYVYFLGNYKNNYTMVVNPPSLASGASIFVPYYSTAASLASPTDVSVVPDGNYLVQRVTAWIWESRRDERFTNAQVEAEKILARLLERENVKSEAYYDTVSNYQQTHWNFRLGRD